MWMHPWALWLLAAVAAVAVATWWRPIRRSTVVASVHLWRGLVEDAGPGCPGRLRPPLPAWWLLLGGSIAAVIAVAGPVDRQVSSPAAPPAAAPSMVFDAVAAVAVAGGSDQLFVALRSQAAFARPVVVTVLAEPTGAVLTAGFILPPGGRVVRVFDVPPSAAALHVLVGGDGALSATLTRRRSPDAAAAAFGRDNPFIRRLMGAMARRTVPSDPDAASFAAAVGEDLSAGLPALAYRPASPLPAPGAGVRHARPWMGWPRPGGARGVAPADAARMLLAEGPGLEAALDGAPRVPEADVPPPAAEAFAWAVTGAGRASWHGQVPPVVRRAAPPAAAPARPRGRWEGPAVLAGLLWMAGWRRLGRIL
ncbi:MAG: hypothetical protein GX591_12560 [Planctomycetes bacterium]|nr:hypothetical protein [Planctomycetota bacterium]